MVEQPGVVRAISWRDLFPWLILFRTFRLAIGLPLLLLALVPTLITPISWRCAELFLRDDDYVRAFDQVVEHNRRWPGQRQGWLDLVAERELTGIYSSLPAWRASGSRIEAVFRDLSAPFRQLFGRTLSLTQFAYLLFGGLTSLLAWAFFGGALTRIAIVRLGREERIGVKEASGYAGRHFFSYFAAPLFPLLGIVVVVVMTIPTGWMLSFNFSSLFGGIVWPLVLLGGYVMAILLLGLLFGWPLMWPTISAEQQGDVFEAAQRCYAYTFGRPLHYLFYAAVAVFLGGLGWLLVAFFTEGIIWTSHWATSWGAGNERMAEIERYVAESGDELGFSLLAGTYLIGLFESLVRSVANAFAYSYFWCAASAIYLLLRRNVDQTEFDEVFFEESRSYELPPLEMDEAEVAGATDADSNSADEGS